MSLNDCAWYLRADSPVTKNHWIDVIDSFKAESGYGSENNLKRNGSSLSILSSNMSTMSPVFKKNKGLQDKLSELIAFRSILINQIDRLQMYFDTCLADFASSNGNYYIIIKYLTIYYNRYLHKELWLKHQNNCYFSIFFNKFILF